LIGILLLPVIAILWIMLVITSLMAAWQAWNGGYYRYPLIQGLVEKL
jgi:uncharacterized protein